MLDNSYKIPPHLPLPKGGFIPPLWQRGARGDFLISVISILKPIIFICLLAGLKITFYS
jgi:hypothetical protein